MALDGLFIRNLVKELQTQYISGRISKIYQPSKTELVFNVRHKGENKKLLMSVHSSYARIHTTEHKYDSPQEPPMFCMMLRKHIEGGFIESIEQEGLERIIKIRILARDEIGDDKVKTLIVELMGKHSNLSLVDEEKGTIIECMKHVPAYLNRVRTLLPGFTFEYPPSQDKINTLEATKEDILRAIDWNQGKIPDQIVKAFQGVSPQLAKEICFRAGLHNSNTIPNAFNQVMNQLKDGPLSPQRIYRSTKDAFSLINLTYLNGQKQEFPSISALLDGFFFEKALRDRVKQVAHDLEAKIQNEVDKNHRKIAKLEEELKEAFEATQYQKYGELLTSYAYSIEAKASSATLLDYYAEEETYVEIPLDPFKSVIDNAQSYFKTYNKFKNSIPIIEEQITFTKEENDYLELILQQIESASVRDIEEIREELVEVGIIRDRKRNKKTKNSKPVIDTFVSSNGTEILVGKNNKQNDYITNRVAARDEIWLHTKDIPGSHVIIRDQEPNEETLIEAARLAAYFSKSKHSSHVPVDYTRVRYVKKVRGAKPGFVTYENQRTLYVDPSFTHIEMK